MKKMKGQIKWKLKKKKNVDDGSNKSFVKVPLLYSIYSHDTKKKKKKKKKLYKII